MNIFIIMVALSIVGVSAIVALYFIKKILADKHIQNSEQKARQIIQEAKREVAEIKAKAEEEARQIKLKSRSLIEDEIRKSKQALEQSENRLMQKERHLDDREARLTEKETMLSQEMEKVKNLKKRQEKITQELLNVLEKAAGLSKEEAKAVLLKNVDREIKHRAGLMIKEVEEQAKRIANRKAKEIVSTAIQRTAVEHVSTLTTSIVSLPDDEMKGRIIGREGRNIRAFEAITGVDIIIDDTPQAVVISCFDPIRREVAKLALAKLVEDGRIHPARIEELVDLSRRELGEIIKEWGEKTVDQLGIKLHPKLIELLGKLHFRTSYGQNALAHSIEVANLAAVMASELEVNVTLAKRAGLLHDLGKAVDFEQEGSHAKLGEEIARKYNESEEVLNCIAAHHEDVACQTVEAMLVMVADGISAARPGARRESLEAYIKRLRKLESLATSFEGIEKAFAIQAGREIRVMVRPDEVDDPGAHKLALDIAKKVEAEADYPGEVKINIIRETRAVEVAR